MLRLEGVGRQFASGLVALSNISLTIPDGQFLVLLGPSGCGKSTLLRLIAGLDRPDQGAIIWDGGQAPAPGRIGMVFQDPVLLPWADARANAALPLRLRRIARARADEVAARGLGELGLSEFLHVRPGALSGGMRMRVALARALSTEPDLLLLDEPFAALHEPTRHRLQDELRRLHAARGCTIVLVTHSIYEAAYVATRVAVLGPRPGRVIATIETTPHAGRFDRTYLDTVAAIGGLMPAA